MFGGQVVMSINHPLQNLLRAATKPLGMQLLPSRPFLAWKVIYLIEVLFTPFYPIENMQEHEAWLLLR